MHMYCRTEQDFTTRHSLHTDSLFSSRQLNTLTDTAANQFVDIKNTSNVPARGAGTSTPKAMTTGKTPEQ